MKNIDKYGVASLVACSIGYYAIKYEKLKDLILNRFEKDGCSEQKEEEAQ